MPTAHISSCQPPGDYAVAENTRVEQWPLERLIPYARNPRKNDAAVDRMAASIREFGCEVPVILCDEWTEGQVKAFRLMVNRSVTWADWDEELLGLELLDLKNLDFA